MIIEPRAAKKKQSPTRLPILILALLMLCGLWVYYSYFMPNSSMAPVPDRERPKLVIGGRPVDAHAMLSNGSILLPIELIREQFDQNIYWDAKAQSVIVTTRDRLVKMKTDSLTAYVNRKPRDLNVGATVKDSVVYVPMDVLEALYQVRGRFFEDSGTVVFELLNKPSDTARVLEGGAALRLHPSIREPVVKKMQPDERLVITPSIEGWFAATTESGHFGYVRSGDVKQGPTARPAVVSEPVVVPGKPQGKINLTWEHVITKNPDVGSLKQMDGVNVVSPTWFGLIDDTGALKNKADARYVRWAHDKGYKVWALVDNGFDPKRTSAVLNDLNKREAVIREMLTYAALYQIDGINIDFENVYLEDKAVFTQFIRELAPLAREQGLTLSIDVTAKSTSPTWSLFYDRKALGQAVDYMMLMAYDEFTAGSQVSGSVGSLPWVERGIQGLLEDVPAEKLLLGVPFYTRLWREETKNGRFTVTSKALSMDQAEEALRANQAVIQYDPATGQNYAVYRESGAQVKVWLEDEQSMSSRIALVHKYNLAGVASWRRGFEKQSIWNVIREGLSKALSK